MENHLTFVRYESVLQFAYVDELVTPSSVTTSPSGGGSVTVQRCEPGQFSCHSEECISVSLLCDGHSDCKDHSDEIGCGKDFIFLLSSASKDLKNVKLSGEQFCAFILFRDSSN